MTHCDTLQHAHNTLLVQIAGDKVDVTPSDASAAAPVFKEPNKIRHTHMNVSCHEYECVTSHIGMRHVTHMNVSCHAYECVMSRI